jgi:hypothetical protein
MTVSGDFSRRVATRPCWPSLLSSRTLQRFPFALAALLLAWLGLVVNAAEAQVSIQKSVEAGSKSGRPWLVCFVFDKSGSMNTPCAEDPTGGNRPNWTVVVADACQKLEQFRSTLGEFDIRLYGFGSAACDFASPMGDRTFSVTSDADVADLVREVRAIPTPRRGETTNLWNSIAAVAQGLERTRAGTTYGGAVVVVFSDGEDSINASSTPEARRKSMLSALGSARKSVDIRLSVLPIGEWKRNPDGLRALGALGDIAELGKAIRLPSVTKYTVTPSAVPLAQLPEAGKTAELAVSLAGFSTSDVEAASFSLAEAAAGLQLEPTKLLASGGTLRFRATRPLTEGASATVVARFRDSEGIEGTASFRVVVPGFKTVAPVEQWGLPDACADLGGARAVVLKSGEPLQLSVSAPVDASIAWTVDGRPAGNGPLLRVDGLTPGAHEVALEVATADQKRSASVRTLVIDSTMSIEAPKSARAGDSVKFVAKAPELPAELASRLGPVVWGVRGIQTEGPDILQSRFDRRGSERVSASRTLSLCGRTFDFSASTILEVRPGPALRLVGGEVVRGRESRIEAHLSGADEIAKVVFVIGNDAIEASIDPPSEGKPATAWIRRAFRDGDSITVRAVPILKDDRGVDRAIDDPECAARAQSRVYSIVDPDVAIVVEAPTAGASLPFGMPVDIRVVPTGRDAESVTRIAISMTPSAGQPTAIDLVKSANWTTSFTPRSEMGSAVEVAAQAFDATGPIGAPVRFRSDLAAARPALRLTGAAATGTVTWGGRNENPPPVTAAIVTEGTDRPYAMAEIRELRWRAADTGLSLESKSESAPQATFVARAAGTHRIVASVTSADGKQYELTADATLRPDPVVPGPTLVDGEVTGTSTIRVDHSSTKGAWSDVVLRGRRSDGEWKSLVNGGFESAPSSTESAQIEAWYRPWGTEASETPWNGATGWVRSEPMTLTLFPPRNYLILSVAIAVALALAAIAWKLCVGHVYWGASAWWTDVESDEPPQELPEQRISIIREKTYNAFFKRVTLPIDAPKGGDGDPSPYHWVAALREKQSTGGQLPAVRFKYVNGPGELEYRNTSGQSFSKPDLRYGHNRIALVVDQPDEYQKPSHIHFVQKPVYLVLDVTEECKRWCHFTLPFVVLPLFLIALVAAVAALWLMRFI